ncbi:TonB-dependent receptor [Hymenobacter sp. H14-R3]|uniref:SusC/RagA family TonB-linked outer membrane protein n=1 Tax=Hymenobacter sp. H14-R3 TaxID=3046308 RepID=UPI0024BA445F|nr:TonB-dependent receptor [Hymenobacter sp. H14-R3]MDJ0363639.1 TonB-dependent receptor [Hymenobacter sp. H14-R3]
MKTVLLAAFLVLTLLLRPFGAAAQAQAVQGTVKDNKGEPAIGATVRLKAGTSGSTVDANGNFQLTVPSLNETLIVSFTGMTTQEVPLNGRSTVAVILAASEQALNDVVVIGYGTARKSDLTGSVASVTGKQLTQVATSDPVQALQGRVAGVTITSNSGQPGSGTRIRVRGVGTINNSDPLYVVDGFLTSDISFLLPENIESTEILKDASATAIYGSRGANGVVVITTKHGKEGKAQFNLSSYVGFQQIRKKLDLTTAAQYATLVSEAYANENKPLPADLAAQLPNAIATNAQGTNWQDLVSQRGIIESYSLSAAGGTEQNRYLVSGAYFQQDGIVKNSGLKKYIVRLNDDLVLSERIKAGLSATFTHSQLLANSAGGNPLFNSSITASPISSPYNADGSYAYDQITSFTPNLARVIEEQQYNKTSTNDLFTNAYVDVKLIKGLSFRSNFGIRYTNNNPRVYLPKYYLGANDQRSISSLQDTRTETVGYVWSNFLNYSLDLGDNSSFSATLGQEAQQTTFNGTQITAFDVPANADLQYITAARNSVPSIGQVLPTDNSLLSYFARANYTYKDRYLLTGTVRLDQTSKFLPSVRRGVFPSVGAGWRISNEEFLKNVTAISLLKLRASYGGVGNQNAAPSYGFASVALNQQNYVFNNTLTPGLAVAQLNNPNLKWETAITSDIGVDLDLLGSKLSFTADYFERRTKDMIALLPVPNYVGQGPPAANVAALRNRGLELALTYRDVIGKLGYTANVNLTTINNRITSLGGATPIASGNVLAQFGNTTLTDVGREVAYFYGLEDKGIFHNQGEVDAYKNADGSLIQPNAKPGDVKYQDVNGDGKIDPTDRTYVGSATPRFSYGASLNLTYSGLDFQVLLYGVQGAEAVNAPSFNLLKSSSIGSSWSNFYASRLDRWSPSNPTSDQPRMTSAKTDNDLFSSRYVEDASYLRVRNVQLGYTLPTDLLSKYQVGSLRVYASVDNLFTITKYTGLDPEISASGYYNNPLAYGVDFGNYPQPRTYRLGVNVNF